MIPPGTAPAETCLRAVSANSSSGGMAVAIASTSCSWIAGSVTTSPNTDRTRSRPGSSAISAEFARPPATSPPPAWS